MCFWQQEYTRDFRGLSKYRPDGNLRIHETKRLEFSCPIHLRVYRPFRLIAERIIGTYFIEKLTKDTYIRLQWKVSCNDEIRNDDEWSLM